MSFTKFGYLDEDFDNEPTVYGINPSNISHTQLKDIGVNTHPEIDDHINSSINPHGENLTQTNLTCDTINAINTDPLISGGGVKIPHGMQAPNILLDGVNNPRLHLKGVTPNILLEGAVSSIRLRHNSGNYLELDQGGFTVLTTSPVSMKSRLNKDVLFINTLNEVYDDSGVTIDGCLIKDGLVDGVDVDELHTNFNAHVGASIDPHGTTLHQTTLACSTINERVEDAGVTIDGLLIKDGEVDGVDVSQLNTNFNDHVSTSVNPHGTTLTQSAIKCNSINPINSGETLIVAGLSLINANIYCGRIYCVNSVYSDNINERNSGNGVTVDGVLIKDGTVDGVNVSQLNTNFNDHVGTSVNPHGANLIQSTLSCNIINEETPSNSVSFPNGFKTGIPASLTDTKILNFFELLVTSSTTQQPWDDAQDVKIYIQKINLTVSITVIGYNLGTANTTGANIILTNVIPTHCRPVAQVEQPFLVIDNHDFRLGKITIHTNGNLEFSPAYFTPSEKFTQDSGLFQQSVRYSIV